MKKMVLFIMPFCLLGCSESKEKEEPKRGELTEFVYVDRTKWLHVDKNCMSLIYLGDEDNSKGNYQVSFVETKSLSPKDYKSVCSLCVSNETFKKIREITEKNSYGDEEESDSCSSVLKDFKL